MDFYVTLPSNVIFKDNKIGQYTTLLAKRLKLDGDWVVGLKALSFTKSWYTLKNDITFSICNPYQKHITTATDIKVKSGNYTGETIVEKINKQRNDEKVPIFVFDPTTHKVGFKPGEEGKHKFYPVIEGGEILGLNKEIELFKKAIYMTPTGSFVLPLSYDTFKFKPKLDAFHKGDLVFAETEFKNDIQTVVVTTNIIEHCPYGDTMSQILQVITIPSANFGDQVYLNFSNPNYKSLRTNSFQEIEIGIKDEFNNDMSFRFGRVIVVLHFKKL